MNRSATEALQGLREGNARFASDKPLHHFTAEERAATVAGQKPWAVVVGCSDSRVPVEAVFDVGVGEVFVVRTAGHVLTEAGLASVRFAVEVLGARLIVVLGHQECGAVSAALKGGAPAWLDPILNKIDISEVRASCAPDDADDKLLAAAVDSHVLASVDRLKTYTENFDVAAGEIMVLGGAYKLASGEVHWLEERCG
jgi:carbonic anhydrase